MPKPDSIAVPEPPARIDRGAVGREVEERAWRWWEENRPGARLVARNYLRRGGEIDLIVEERRMPRGGRSPRLELVFVEVRARRGPGAWVTGVESVVHRKRSRIERTARVFMAAYRGQAKAVRFDVLSWDGHRFEHREAAWLAGS